MTTPLQAASAKIRNVIRNYGLGHLSEIEAEVIARAVIQALRNTEPTKEMKVAGAFCEPFLTEAGQKPWTPGQIIAQACFEAMLDAALSEESAAALS
jgi:hypothetical protein